MLSFWDLTSRPHLCPIMHSDNPLTAKAPPPSLMVIRPSSPYPQTQLIQGPDNDLKLQRKSKKKRQELDRALLSREALDLQR